MSWKNWNCASPTFPLPKNLYIKPTKSSADGVVKNLNLPFLAPTVCALALENSASDFIPVLSSRILFIILTKVKALLALANWTSDFTSTWSSISFTALTFLIASSAK